MKKRSLAALLLALLAAVIFASPAIAAVPKRPENQYVLDSAKVLSEETERKIIQENQRMFQEYGGEVVVVAVDFFGGESREDYANHIFNQWGIGSSEWNNGLLLVLGIGEEDYYATAGSGIDDYFDGGTLDDMLYEYLEPDFAAEDYDAGVRKIFDALVTEMDTCCAGFTAGNNTPVEDNLDDWTQEDDETILWLVFAVLRVVVVVVILLFIFSLLRRIGRGGGSGSGFAQGMFFGSMLGGRRRRWWGPPPPPPPPPGFGPGPRPGGFGGPGPGPRPGGPPPRGPRPPSGGFGGFGGSGRPGGFSSGGRSRGVGGGRSSFGGGGRSGGFHGGGSSHGGGAGRRK